MYSICTRFLNTWVAKFSCALIGRDKCQHACNYRQLAIPVLTITKPSSDERVQAQPGEALRINPNDAFPSSLLQRSLCARAASRLSRHWMRSVTSARSYASSRKSAPGRARPLSENDVISHDASEIDIINTCRGLLTHTPRASLVLLHKTSWSQTLCACSAVLSSLV